MAPIGNKPKHKGKAILAGGLAGAFEICCTYPTEYVKTTMQLSTHKVSIGEIIKSTIKNRGFFGLYRGLDSMLYFAMPKAATRFGVNEYATGLLSDANGGDRFGLGSAKGFVAGLCAGTAEAILVTTPQETIKIKLINDTMSAQPRFRGFFHGVSTIIKETGFSGVYKGLGPTVIKVATAQATRFGVFSVLQKQFELKGPLQTAVAGGFAGGLSVVMFQGIDVIKSRMQGLEGGKYKNAFDCAAQMMRKEGITAFYKGMAPRLTRVVAEVAITMSLYGEFVKLLDSVWKTE